MERKPLITWHDFEKIDLRIGTIVAAEFFEKAKKPAYVLMVDFGQPLGVLQSSAQLTKRYAAEDLIGRQVMAIVNFPEKQIANKMSQCLVMGAVGDDNDVVLLKPDVEVPNGWPVA